VVEVTVERIKVETFSVASRARVAWGALTTYGVTFPPGFFKPECYAHYVERYRRIMDQPKATNRWLTTTLARCRRLAARPSSPDKYDMEKFIAIARLRDAALLRRLNAREGDPLMAEHLVKCIAALSRRRPC
jgi:hypothetical protein